MNLKKEHLNAVADFRGKDIITGEWVYGSLYHANDGTYIIPNDQTLWITESEGVGLRSLSVVHKVEPQTVSEFVMVDKNDTKIYTGDVLKKYVRRLSTNPWWRVSSKTDGYDDSYFIHKLVVKSYDEYDVNSFKLIDTKTTKEERGELCEPMGAEKSDRVVDDLNYNKSHLELVGNVWDNPQFAPDNLNILNILNNTR